MAFLDQHTAPLLCGRYTEATGRALLLLWRHRFIPDTWGWEVPGGGVNDGESLERAATRELLEETGWKATGPMRHLLTVEPANGISDATYHIYVTDQAEHVDDPRDQIESTRLEWIPLADIPDMITAGKIRSADTIAGLMQLHHRRFGAEA